MVVAFGDIEKVGEPPALPEPPDEMLSLGRRARSLLLDDDTAISNRL
ncbi:hypothetical protein C6341_g25780 [Phytophthora cactorum]|nr:hypothetical protein C6341_g25780 [Phytophthora cactorum]